MDKYNVRKCRNILSDTFYGRILERIPADLQKQVMESFDRLVNYFSGSSQTRSLNPAVPQR